MEPEKPEMTVRQAGRLGGEAVKAKHGVEHYHRIGKLGGVANLAKRGHDYYVEIGKKGRASRKVREAGRSS